MQKPGIDWTVRGILITHLVVMYVCIRHAWNMGWGMGSFLGGFDWFWLIFFLLFLVSALLGLFLFGLTWTTYWKKRLAGFDGLVQCLRRKRRVLIVGLILLAILLWFLLYGLNLDSFRAGSMRLGILWVVVLAGTFFLHGIRKEGRLIGSFLGSALLFSAVFRIILFTPEIQTNPLSLGWSEGSRYYYGSLFLARSIYGETLPLSVLHPSRYLLQSVPFLFSLPIWVHRLWQVLLWVVCNGLAVWLLVRRIRPVYRYWWFLFGLFGFVFLFQGPVYYHLILCTVPVLAWYNGQKPWRTLAIVVAASLWAGISRINWFPVPGLLAAVLYILETPLAGRKWIRYFVAPVGWTMAGTAAAWLFNQGYEKISGNSPEVFGSALQSPLLWNRLFSNSTYPPGILMGTIYALFPALTLILVILLLHWRSWHPLRILALVGIIGVFLGGGLIVSLKIGGGSNLHNLDAALFFVLVIGLFIWAGKFLKDRPNFANRSIPWWLVGIVVLMPVTHFLELGQPITMPGREDTDRVLQTLQTFLDEHPGRVLLIADRHLIPLDILHVQEFEPEYEKVWLMEMAMAGNTNYLDQFYKKLNNHEFSIIITNVFNMNLQDDSRAFSEENNIWVERVELPVAKAYQSVLRLEDAGLEIWLPKDQP
ncbi:MAG TPA: hypothetical protein PLS77_01855 [Anaerolineaceae bacterium]|nr:hypothetical protein [Anaerolineaceae bacterium]HQF44549.1 hypothetical protein [Anaerolineaceae bacterium]HQH34435.1 hypothetical protein [Anaerolineaceae bacterium]HQJ02572.1 hypothetical protein [Anaerolineaceae bacterium]